jgi:hypothetical protein
MLRTLAILSLGASVFAADTKEARDPVEVFAKDIKPILQKHCYDCHGAEKQKGDLNLQAFETLDSIKDASETWTTVLERVYAFEMPPEGKYELSFDKQRRLTDWLKDTLPKSENADCDQIASDRNANFYRGHVMSRRINRAEYANSIRDLFGVAVDVSDLLPTDGGGGEGFDTAGNALFVSSIHIEKYLAAADQVAARVLPKFEVPLSSEGQAARENARRELKNVARRAYRRPIADEEIDRTMAMFDRAWNRGDGYTRSLSLALKSILISPHFLFLVEPEPVEKGIQPLGPLPLASRISYFLWSSMPDEPLLAAGESGKLLEGDELRAQVRRMLADPKAQALGERFAVQWLDVERLGGEVKPDPNKFPEFTSDLQHTMLAEVTAFFNHIVQADRPLTDLIDADYTFVNERLAELYGIKDISGAELRKVNLSNKNRGGVIGMAAVHALTSFPLRTSPVLRGRWVLESMLGEKVKPPPPDVPALEEHSEKAKNLSLREQLEQHRLKAECASCHDKMDPLGFGMENFDVLGRWRDTDRGQPIDSKGTLPNGDSFTGPAGLKTILMSRKDEVIKHLVRKMMGYAYGRELNKFDNCVVDKAMEALKNNEYKPSVLIEHIVLSFPFRHRFYPKLETASVETNQ